MSSHIWFNRSLYPYKYIILRKKGKNNDGSNRWVKEKFENPYHFTDSAAVRLDTRWLGSGKKWNRWWKKKRFDRTDGKGRGYPR